MAGAVARGSPIAKARTDRIRPGRAKVAFYMLCVIAAFLAYRLYEVQVVEGPSLSRQALEQRSETVETFARRGAIYDADHQVLVRSLPSESIYADPNDVVDPVSAGRKLAAALSLKLEDVVAVLEEGKREHRKFTWIERKVPHEIADRLRKGSIDGVSVVQEETGVRYYPSAKLASTVLGFVGIDENGLDGLEYQFDSLLRGTPGRSTIEADEFGRAIPFGETNVIEVAHPGRNLELTLDSYLEFETERALRAQVKKFHAASGSAIVMDPYTGAVLALANVPDYDPHVFSKYSQDSRRDRAVMDAYEPGSTFKLITAAAALESGRLTVGSRMPARNELRVADRTIHNADDDLPASGGSETLEDIIAYSHNVGAAEIGLKIGKPTLFSMIRNFGFGDAAEIGLPGENPGIVPSLADWSGSSLATISFGQGISTTPVAMIRAYAAVANGGMLIRPRILQAIDDADGRVIYRYGTEVEHRVISERTAATLRNILRAVVVRGTGNPTAQVAGYTTAGKTGTAQVVENGIYEPGAYIASFIGYVPADRPRYMILVKIDRPRGAIYGSVVAAPVFAQVAKIAMLHAGIMPRSSAPARAAK
ncbi:MAG TPA: penicillin-binding protein 2 [Candidatus Binatia bacterium]|nr:penicillin-binding protein 2 [Candidatus Binatia bacterium]